jgi:hypothetical protein
MTQFIVRLQAIIRAIFFERTPLHDDETHFGEALMARLIKNGCVKADTEIGCTEAEIKAAMDAQEVDYLPKPYYEFLQVMGHGVKGLFVGSDWVYGRLLDMKEIAIELAAEESIPPFEIPPDAFVFFGHHGYEFQYFHTIDKDPDPPIYQYVEYRDNPQKISANFKEYFDDYIESMLHPGWSVPGNKNPQTNPYLR